MASPDLNRALARAGAQLDPTLSQIAGALGHRAWVAGGFVRDIIIGRTPLDLDLAVEAGAREAAERIAAGLGGSPFPLDEERATYRVALADGLPLRTVDIAVLRGPDIEADLAARDFTVNAMAAELTPPGLGTLIDPAGGLHDARGRRLRMVSERALDEDPLRLLRAVRIAVELQFEIEPATLAAVKQRAPALLQAAAERQRDEIVHIFASRAAREGLRLLDRAGLLEVLFPESAAGRGVEQPGQYHYFDVLDHGIEAVGVVDRLLSEEQPASGGERRMRAAFWHSLGGFGLKEYFRQALGGSSRLVLMKLATFLHDVAKPETKSVEADGRVRFLGHPEIGARVAIDVCKRLRFGNRETAFVSRLVAEHLRPPQIAQSGVPTDRAIFRFLRDLGDAAPACLVLSLADAAAAVGPPLTLERWTRHLAYIRYVMERGALQEELLAGAGASGARGKRHFVSGDTLIRALGIEPGPEVGRLLAAIDEAAASGEVTTGEGAIQLAKQLLAGETDGDRGAGAA